MIHLQILERDGANVHALIRKAIVDGRIKSFETAQVVGGLKIVHKKHPGVVKLVKSSGPLLATVSCKNSVREFQLLEAFIGRLVYHFAGQIEAINMQLPRQD